MRPTPCKSIVSHASTCNSRLRAKTRYDAAISKQNSRLRAKTRYDAAHLVHNLRPVSIFGELTTELSTSIRIYYCCSCSWLFLFQITPIHKRGCICIHIYISVLLYTYSLTDSIRSRSGELWYTRCILPSSIVPYHIYWVPHLLLWLALKMVCSSSQ